MIVEEVPVSAEAIVKVNDGYKKQMQYVNVPFTNIFFSLHECNN
jgi:hypothetical protein